ncbi:restriction endonuclease subunit S [Paraprevotella xylaniphila]|uniref:restriction endonuclease subunit S n=1 Tax=Paraprevotella xylaniphila TaxID=454155 RepID=UPI0023EF6995|nr:restriction endonuclease subunit S [Paraprevotella xylaniphila]
MNKGEMKRLGDYIREVDVRNRDLEVTKLLGVSISKEFMPSIANTIGTDMSSYKVVEPRQFAYGPVTSRNGDKVSIALHRNDEKAIVSQAYTIFEVKNKQELLPEFLMMWFRRPEFDRYARFKSHGSAREIFSWEEMCDVELPVPPIEQQQKIVSEYEAVTRRIRLNERIIAKLEETAQALYRKMFVDGIDKENLPEGWRMGSLGEIADFAYGKMPDKTSKGSIPIFSGYGIVGYTSIPMYEKQLIVVIARGDAGSGKIVLSPNIFYLTNLAIAILLKDDNMKYYLYYHLLNSDTSTLRSGSAQAQVTINSLYSYEIIIPSNNDCIGFDKLISPISEQKLILSDENIKLTELQSLLLAKMGQ